MGANNFQVPSDVIPVVPSDTTSQPGIAIRATAAGNVVLLTAAGNERTIPIAAGETLTVQFTQVKAASTATGLIRFA